MARRKKMTKAESGAFGFLIIIGIVVFVIVEFFKAVGFVAPSVLLILGVGFYLWNKSRKEKEKAARVKAAYEHRVAYLREKYKDESIVDRILNENIWQGQTAEQLRDTLGAPLDTDSDVLKTKVKEVWKYRQFGVNRYGLRVKLENDLVVGWDEKA